MCDKIYRLSIWRFGNFPIDVFEVVDKTEKTVVIRVYHEVGDGFEEAFCENRYSLKSETYIFYDSMKEAKHAAENIVAHRLAYHIERADELRERLQQVCKHRAIRDPSGDAKCIRCDTRVTNPQDYNDGG